MQFPSSVLCNGAGQGVLRQKVRNAVNSLNRDWNFCSYSVEGLWKYFDTSVYYTLMQNLIQLYIHFYIYLIHCYTSCDVPLFIHTRR